MRNQISLTTTSLQQNCCSKCCSKARLTLWNPHKYWVYSFTVFIVGIIRVRSTCFNISARISSYLCFGHIRISLHFYTGLLSVYCQTQLLLSLQIVCSTTIPHRSCNRCGIFRISFRSNDDPAAVKALRCLSFTRQVIAYVQ